MEPDSKMSSSGPGDDDNNMADVEVEAATAPTEASRQRVRLAATDARPQTRVPDPSGDSAMFDLVTSRSMFFRSSETPLDPLVPPKFRRRRLSGRSPPSPVMSSPPRPPSRNDWKIPPCISEWKNPKGYAVALDLRLAGVSEEDRMNPINHNFVRLSESLYAAEMKAREAVRTRAAYKETRARLMEQREQMIRQLDASARGKTAAGAAAAPAAPPPVSAGEDTGDRLPEVKRSVSENCGAGAGEQLEKVTKTDEGLSAGAPARVAGKRERPVELDEPEQGDDPFDLDGFMAQVKKGKED